MDEVGQSPKVVAAPRGSQVHLARIDSITEKKRTPIPLYFDQHAPSEVRTPGRDRLAVGVSYRGLLMGRKVYDRIALIDACMDNGHGAVTGWCGVRT
jgi:hypothetical protein